ncbi:translation initiation factor IF-3 [Dethiothermospora halolimnae]|uniref:translation initiation factor IF-3 n=1 Tax=Dethiothermospora halolimnae TaxID=3114390 RepID=UPI003CCC1EAD
MYEFFRRCLNIKELQINEQIRDREVRLIGSNGDQLGIMPVKKAQQMADDNKMDLVKVAPKAKPPVCRIMDYGKYKYEMAKKEKEAKKNQKIINIKEIRLTPKIEEHDLEVKAKKARKFLEKEDKVKVTVRFRGRELGHTELGREVLMKFADKTAEFGQIEKRPKMEGRNMIMFLSPKSL